MAKEGKKPGSDYLNFKRTLINEGIRTGLESLIKNHPELKRQGAHLINYLDSEGIDSYVTDAIEEASEEKGGKLENKDISSIVKTVAKSVSNADAFDDKGKEIILRRASLEQQKGEGFFKYLSKGKVGKAFGSLGASKLLKQEDYVTRAAESFGEILELMKSGGYAQHMPQLEEAAKEIYHAGFFSSAADILFREKLMNSSTYNQIKKAVYTKSKSYVETFSEGMKAYFEKPVVKNATSAVLGVIGLASLIANNSITGNVIGMTKPNIFGLLGGLILVISAIMILVNAKKSIKRKPKVKKRAKKRRNKRI